MATTEEYMDALRVADEKARAGDPQAKEDAAKLVSIIDQRRAMERQTTENRSRVAQGYAPNVDDRFTRTYNPSQNPLTYAANEVGRAVMDLGGMASRAGELIPGVGPAMRAARPIAQAYLDKVKSTLGIEEGLKAPGPFTQFATHAGIDTAQNLAFGGGLAKSIVSGIGSSVGRDIAKPFGEVPAAAASMVGGAVLPAMLSTRVGSIGAIYDYLRKDPAAFEESIRKNPELVAHVRNQIHQELTRDLGDNLDLYRQNVQRARELESAIPGLKLNLGQLTTAPSVVQQQRMIDRSNQSSMNAAQIQADKNQRALMGSLGAQPGAREAAAGAIQDVAEVSSAQSRNLAGQIGAMSDDLSKISSQVARRVDVTELGEQALTQRRSLLGQARTKASQLMDVAETAYQAEREAIKTGFDPSRIVNRANEVLKQPIWDDANSTSIFGKLRQFGAQADEVVDDTKKFVDLRGQQLFSVQDEAKNTLEFRDIREMREAVNADITSALRSNSPNARQQLRNLVMLKNEIDATVKESPFQNTRQAYDAFVGYYRDEFAPRFLRGVNLLPDKTTALGESRLPPEKVFSSYFKPGNVTGINNYTKLYGDNPESMLRMRDYITDLYTQRVIEPSGMINPDAHRRFMNEFKAPLGALNKAGFNFTKDFDDGVSAFAAVNDRMAALKSAAEAADKSAVNKLFADSFGSQTPETVVREALGDERKMAAVIGRMNAQQSRGFVDYVKDSLAQSFTKDGVVTHNEIGKFLSDTQQVKAYRLALSKVYGSEAANKQMSLLQRISEAAQRIELTPPPSRGEMITSAPSMFRDDLQRKIGLSIATVGNMVRATVAGRVSPEWAAAALGTQAFATVMQKMKNEVYAQIIKDPDAAEKLLTMLSQKPDSPGFIKATGQLLKKVPSLVGYWAGSQKWGEYAPMTSANVAREYDEKEAAFK